MALVLIWLIITVPACIILHNKKRGAGYYILAIFFPLIGLIFALCLKKIDTDADESKSLDITENEH